jgi:predicted RNA-binding Zn-ribbon protein involved in translation (DUF1610 family)
MDIPSNHTTIHDAHPRSPVNLKSITTLEIPIVVVPKPTKRYLKKLTLDYVHCPECESQEIIYSGISKSETQRYKCKKCHYQFVLQFDAVFPPSTRNIIFENEFLSNIKPTGFQTGCGRKEYWMGAKFKVLHCLESRAIRIRFNKMIKTTTIHGESDYRLLLRFIVDEAYVMVTE